MIDYIKLFVTTAVVCLGAATPAHAVGGEAIYQAKCSSCHDSGAGQAPRLSVPADWREREARGRAAMHASALHGIPATAMAARGGYAELSDTEIRLTVDYMLARVGFRDRAITQTAPSPAVPAAAPVTAGGVVDDATLVGRVAEALKKSLAPGARIEHYAGEATLRGVTIRVGARDGVVTLSGAVEQSALIPRALAVAQAVAGARRVDSRLVTAGMLDFD